MTFEELLANEEVAKQLEKAESKEEALDILKAAGLNMSEAELAEKLNALSEELKEDDLDSVSGGTMLMPIAPLPWVPVVHMLKKLLWWKK